MKSRGYRLLWCSTMGHNSAFYAVTFITGWLAYSLMDSSVGPGLVALLTLMPGMVVGRWQALMRICSTAER